MFSTTPCVNKTTISIPISVKYFSNICERHRFLFWEERIILSLYNFNIFFVLTIDCHDLHLGQGESLTGKHWAEALPLAGQEGGCRMSALLYHGVQNSEAFGLRSNNHSVNDDVFACPLWSSQINETPFRSYEFRLHCFPDAPVADTGACEKWNQTL